MGSRPCKWGHVRAVVLALQSSKLHEGRLASGLFILDLQASAPCLALRRAQQILLSVGKNGLSKAVHALIPETCKYVTLHGKRGFTDGIKVTDLKIASLFWIS